MARLLALVLVLGGVVALCVACVDTRFLRGIACDGDDDCGRSLRCSAGFCGGCPESLLADGTCPCPGDRILDCRKIDPSVDECIPMCTSQADLCSVAIVEDDDYAALDPCDPTQTDQGRCFTIQVESAPCDAGHGRIALDPSDPPPPAMYVNCPPPPTDEGPFDCADG